MDELQISGRRFISSRRAAKEHKYHSDYIGQLIRGGKVVGQKVGRAWYVEASSLAEYLGNEGAAAPTVAYVPEKEIAPVVRQAEIIEEPTPVVEETVPEEEPVVMTTHVEEPAPVVPVEEVVADVVVEEKVHRVPLHTPATSTSRYPGDKKQTTITYIADDAPLIPTTHTHVRGAATEPTFVDDAREVQGSLSGYARNTQARRKFRAGNYVRFGVMGVIAVAVVAIITGVSFFTSYNMSVEGGQVTASVYIAGMSL